MPVSHDPALMESALIFVKYRDFGIKASILEDDIEVAIDSIITEPDKEKLLQLGWGFTKDRTGKYVFTHRHDFWQKANIKE